MKNPWFSWVFRYMLFLSDMGVYYYNQVQWSSLAFVGLSCALVK